LGILVSLVFNDLQILNDLLFMLSRDLLSVHKLSYLVVPGNEQLFLALNLQVKVLNDLFLTVAASKHLVNSSYLSL
jgi:hypothetical protein